jgi:hypothetical protein
MQLVVGTTWPHFYIHVVQLHTCSHSNSYKSKMENSSSSSFTDLVTYSFTDLVNYSIPTSDPQNPNTQHGLQTHFPMIFYPTSLLPGSFHSNTIHKTSIHLESNQVTSFQLQATTMACLSMAIFYGGDTAGSSSSPVSSTCMFLVGG